MRPLSEARTVSNLNRIAQTSQTSGTPPATGITSSTERLGDALDQLHDRTIRFMEGEAAKIGDEFRLSLNDVMNFLWAKLRVKQ